MVRFFCFLAWLLLLAMANCACSILRKDLMGKQKRQKRFQKIKSEFDAMPVRLPLGTVHLVHPDGQFVLIKSSQNFSPDPGTEITTFGPDGRESGQLKVGSARKANFITADIVSGTPKQGDRAIMNYLPPKPSSDQAGGEAAQVLE